VDKEVKPSVFALTGYAVTSASSFAIFLAKKMAAGIFIFPRHPERLFELKTSEFCCEMKF